MLALTPPLKAQGSRGLDVVLVGVEEGTILVEGVVLVTYV
jgi:hypothetical protein